MGSATNEWVGRKVVVTGAQGGLGRGLTGLFAERGAQVVGVDVAGSGADVEADLRDEAEAQRAIEDAADRLGGIDRLVGGAGVVDTIHRASRFPTAAFRGDIEGNLLSQFFVAQAAYPFLKQAPGAAAVLVSSIAGLDGALGQAAYATAKAGVVGMIRTLAAEWAGDDIRINGVAPGLFATPKVKALPAETTERLLASVPMRRVGTIAEVTEPIAFLLSDASTYMTGQVLRLDGGAGLGTEGLFRRRTDS